MKLSQQRIQQHCVSTVACDGEKEVALTAIVAHTTNDRDSTREGEVRRLSIDMMQRNG